MFKFFLRPQFVVIVFILLIAAMIGFGPQRVNASNPAGLGFAITKVRKTLVRNTLPPPTTPPIPGPTNTVVTSTPTITQTPGVVCSPVNATIAAPFTYDGTGQTFCWQSTNLGTIIDSWNLATLTINGTSYANVFITSSSYPTKINGYWYVYLVSGTTATGHFEAK